MSTDIKNEMRILYVEDQADVRQLTLKILSRRYKNISTAEHGREGLKIFNEQSPSIVITDVKMPVIDGLSMIREIKAVNKNVKIILTTAHSDLDYFVQAIELGIDHYILKPIDVENLYVAIEKCIYQLNIELDLQRKSEEIQAANVLLKAEIESRKIIEAELLSAKEKAEESDRLKTAFLANMSHEIRTPLNSILGFAELLKNQNLTKEKKERYVGIINDAGKDLLEVINDIIDISKIEAGQVTVNKIRFSINEMLNDLYDIYDAEITYKNKSIELVRSFALNDNDCIVLADDVRIRQILKNLISNSIKFTQEGHIEFGYTRKDSNTVVFYVKDSGIGIDRKNHKIIFERFRQADESTTREYGGTGLGLAITKSLVEIMEGTIWLESEKGSGAVFYFSLPVEFENTSSSIIQKLNEESYSWQDKSILIVEDILEGFLFLQDLIEPTHAKIFHAENGKDAIDICKSKKIDIVLMDLQLPGMNGLEATKIIKSMMPDIPVIAQTASILSDSMIEAKQAGCCEYLTKPINKDSLLETVDRYLH